MTAEGHYDVLITNGLVLTLEPGDAPLAGGFVAVRDGRIVEVGSMSESPVEAGAGEILDVSGGLVMPGLVNAHTHAAMTLFRGLADDLPLMAWLEEHIFPAEAAQVDENLVYWGAKLACAEMLLSGTTCFADGYFFEDQAARAVQETGMRAVLGQGVLDFPAPGVPDPAENIAAAREFIERWRGVSPLIRPSIFCHSPYTCSPETLVRGKNLARDLGVLFQIHAAETRSETAQVLAQRGLTPIRYLDSLGILDRDTLAVHCVHLDDEEIDILAERGTPAAVCVESQMKLASGVARVPEMSARGVRLALGTDGPASNNDLNLLGEVRSLALFFKAATLDPTVLPAAQVLSLAGPGGARALGWGDESGTLRPGMRADLIVLDLKRPHLQPLYNPYSHLVYACTGREIAHVLVEGRVLVRHGRLTTVDVEETLAKVREIAAGIRK